LYRYIAYEFYEYLKNIKFYAIHHDKNRNTDSLIIYFNRKISNIFDNINYYVKKYYDTFHIKRKQDIMIDIHIEPIQITREDAEMIKSKNI
jgi:hypothetical protein